jgi:copper chaperone
MIMKRQFSVAVPGMSCGHCVKRITEVLETKGVEGFDVSLEERKVYTDSPLGKDVIRALAEAGYEVA